jgi:amino-acid N-acetyltransferase
MNIQLANAADLPAVLALLEAERLPASDLSEQALEHFLVWREGSRVNAVVGLELYGDIAFLRSLVVAAHARGQGAGSKLTQAAEALAGKTGATTVYLLTQTAEHFFAARGYRRIDRDAAPKSIQGTTQFSTLCPSTAVLMVKP